MGDNVSGFLLVFFWSGFPQGSVYTDIHVYVVRARNNEVFQHTYIHVDVNTYALTR